MLKQVTRSAIPLHVRRLLKNRALNKINTKPRIPSNEFKRLGKDYLDSVKTIQGFMSSTIARDLILNHLKWENSNAVDVIKMVLSHLPEVDQDINLQALYGEKQTNRDEQWFELIKSGKITPEALSQFYNLSEPIVTLTYQKLWNNYWLASRILPLLVYVSNFDPQNKTYLEDGGADGLLPLYATQFFKGVINHEIFELANIFSRRLCEVKNISNFATNSNLYDIERSSIDVLSSHQVIEHVADAKTRIRHYFDLLNTGGVLILSSGCGMHPMAGHVPDSIKVHGEEKAIAMDLGFSKLEYTLLSPM